MKYLKYTGYGLGGLLVCFVVVGLILPDKTHIERNVMINATPENVFAAIDSFQEFNSWSPWAKLDPNTQYNFEGPETGVGARMSWSSDNPDVGMGNSEVIAFEPNKNITVAIDFGTNGNAVYDLSLSPQETGTNIKWGFDVDFGWNIIARYFGLFVDGAIGPTYEDGLATLKTIVEEQVALQGTEPPSSEPGFAPSEPLPIFVEN